MLNRFCKTIAMAMFVFPAAGVWAMADESPSPDDVAGWIKQLDDDDFGVRQAAQQSLHRAGAAAIDAVRDAALGKSQEAAARAIDILQRHFRGDDDALRKAAGDVLKQLAAGEDPIVAERAKNALQPQEPKQDQAEEAPLPNRVLPFGGGGIRIEAQAIQIGGDGARRVTMKNIDGNKQIDVEEKDRKIKIVESAEGKIKITISTEEGDMKGNKEIEADSAADLKKKDPDAYKIYEKYSKGGAGGRIQFRALPAVPGGIPRIRIAPGGVPRALPRRVAPQRGAQERFDNALKRLEEARQRLEEAKDVNADSIDEAIKRLDQLRKQLEDQKEKLRDEAEEAKE